MTRIPPIRFMHAAHGGPMPFDQKDLHTALPMTRPSGPAARSDITYEAYLEAVKLFVLGHWAQIQEIIASNGFDPAEIRQMDVIAEKHGSDYHPARIQLSFQHGSMSFVVNVALSERGIQRLTQDFLTLDRLHGTFARCFVPKVYCQGVTQVKIQTGGLVPAHMFLAEWFQDFSEFHVSLKDEKPILVLWNMEAGYLALTQGQAEHIYRQAAFILTYYYNPASHEEIFPWHHAAGDFVARTLAESVDVKLVTVRQYASRWMFAEELPGMTLQALLMFLTNLTIRMRLDRLDGIGDIVWVGQHCVHATLHGFFAALREKIREGRLKPRMLEDFVTLLKGLSPEELAEAFQTTVASCDENAPDIPVILENLVDHILVVYRLFQHLAEPFLQVEN